MLPERLALCDALVGEAVSHEQTPADGLLRKVRCHLLATEQPPARKAGGAAGEDLTQQPLGLREGLGVGSGGGHDDVHFVVEDDDAESVFRPEAVERREDRLPGEVQLLTMHGA